MSTPSDDASIGELLVRAYEGAWGATGWEEYRAELLDVAERRGQFDTLVAETDGVLIGSVSVVPPASPRREIEDPDALEVRMLGVDPISQRRGVARGLIAACVEHARRAGRCKLVLRSDEDLVAAHALYESIGFRRREDLDTTVGVQYQALGYELDVGTAEEGDP